MLGDKLSITILDLLFYPDLKVIANDAVDKVDEPLLWYLSYLSLIRKVIEDFGVVTAEYENVSYAEALVLRYG